MPCAAELRLFERGREKQQHKKTIRSFVDTEHADRRRKKELS